VLAQATREQKRIADQIRIYQSRVAISPEVEEKYKLLTRDYDTAQKFYATCWQKKSTSEMATDMEKRQQGEQMHLLNRRACQMPRASRTGWCLPGWIGHGLVIDSAWHCGWSCGTSRSAPRRTSKPACRCQCCVVAVGHRGIGEERQRRILAPGQSRCEFDKRESRSLGERYVQRVFLDYGEPFNVNPDPHTCS